MGKRVEDTIQCQSPYHWYGEGSLTLPLYNNTASENFFGGRCSRERTVSPSPTTQWGPPRARLRDFATANPDLPRNANKRFCFRRTYAYPGAPQLGLIRNRFWLSRLLLLARINDPRLTVELVRCARQHRPRVTGRDCRCISRGAQSN